MPTQPFTSIPGAVKSSPALGLGMGGDASSAFTGELTMRTKLLQGKSSEPCYLEKREKVLVPQGQRLLTPRKPVQVRANVYPPKVRRGKAGHNQEQRRVPTARVWTPGDVCPSSLPLFVPPPSHHSQTRVLRRPLLTTRHSDALGSP